MAFYLILQRVQVSNILRPRNGALVLDQQFLAQDENRKALEVSGNFTSKCPVSFDAGNARKQIDALRGAAQLNHLLRFGEIRFLEIAGAETKIPKKDDNFRCVLRRWPNEDIEIARVARASVEREAVRADDDVFNAAGV